VFLVMVIIFMVSALAVQAEAQDEKKKTNEVMEKVEAEKRSGLKVNCRRARPRRSTSTRPARCC
jgi:hypothetical protein